MPAFAGSFPSWGRGTHMVMSSIFVGSCVPIPGVLRVLGDGTPRKSYLAVEDCIDGIVTVLAPQPRAEGSFEVYNLGTDEVCRVSDSIAWICTALGIDPKLEYAGGDRGWVGDNPLILLDAQKLRGLGWKPRFTIREGIEATVAWLQSNPWIFENERAE